MKGCVSIGSFEKIKREERLLCPACKATVTDLLTEDEYAKASGMVQIAGIYCEGG